MTERKKVLNSFERESWKEKQIISKKKERKIQRIYKKKKEGMNEKPNKVQKEK